MTIGFFKINKEKVENSHQYLANKLVHFDLMNGRNDALNREKPSMMTCDKERLTFITKNILNG
jgi:hypothetical protein